MSFIIGGLLYGGQHAFIAADLRLTFDNGQVVDGYLKMCKLSEQCYVAAAGSALQAHYLLMNAGHAADADTCVSNLTSTFNEAMQVFDRPKIGVLAVGKQSGKPFIFAKYNSSEGTYSQYNGSPLIIRLGNDSAFEATDQIVTELEQKSGDLSSILTQCFSLAADADSTVSKGYHVYFI